MNSYKCNLIIPGFPKCGTSSFHEYMDVHPQICMSRPKECHYFAMDSIWKKGSSFHNAHFPAGLSSKYFGESSTINCISEIAISRIKDSLYHPKIIILMRNPVARVISHYKWLYVSGIENRSFKKSISESGYEFDPEHPVQGCYKGYLEFSNYTKWIAMWQNEFGTENVLLIKSEGLRNNAPFVLDECVKFLGLDPIEWTLPVESNRTGDVVANVEKPIIKVIREFIPKRVKKYIPMRSALDGFWRKSFFDSKKIEVPSFCRHDIDWVNDLLSEQMKFYDEIFHDGNDVFGGVL